MSIKATNWAFDQQLKPGPKILLLAIADAADDDFLCFPSVEHLTRKATMSRATVFRTLEFLEEHGYLVRSQRYADNGRRRSTLYRVNVGSQIETEGSQPETGEGLTGETGEGLSGETPITLNHQKESSEGYRPVDELFEDWWSGVWKKDGKAAARKAFLKVIQSVPFATLSTARDAQCALYREEGTIKRFMCHASTWLNQERWENEELRTAPNHESDIDEESLDAALAATEEFAGED